MIHLNNLDALKFRVSDLDLLAKRSVGFIIRIATDNSLQSRRSLAHAVQPFDVELPRASALRELFQPRGVHSHLSPTTLAQDPLEVPSGISGCLVPITDRDLAHVMEEELLQVWHSVQHPRQPPGVALVIPADPQRRRGSWKETAHHNLQHDIANGKFVDHDVPIVHKKEMTEAGTLKKVVVEPEL